MQASQSAAAHRAMQRPGQQRWLAPCSSCAGRRTRRRAGRAGQPLSMPRWPCFERCWGRFRAALAWTGRRRRPPDAAGTRCCLATTTAAARPAPPACACCRASEGSGLLGLGGACGVQAGRQVGGRVGAGRPLPGSGRGCPPLLPAAANNGAALRCCTRADVQPAAVAAPPSSRTLNRSHRQGLFRPVHGGNDAACHRLHLPQPQSLARTALRSTLWP